GSLPPRLLAARLQRLGEKLGLRRWPRGLSAFCRRREKRRAEQREGWKRGGRARTRGERVTALRRSWCIEHEGGVGAEAFAASADGHEPVVVADARGEVTERGAHRRIFRS